MSSSSDYKEYPTSAKRLWRKVMSTFWQDHQRDWYEDVMQRTIIYGNLLRKHSIVPRGILYVGANVGQLLWVWVQLGFRQIMMIEPQEKAFESLQWFARYSSGLLLSYEQFVECEEGTEVDAVRCAVGARDGESELFIMSNTNLSSLLEPIEESLQQQAAAIRGSSETSEHIALTSRVQVPVRTLDSLLAEMEPRKATQYNTLYMNIQGGELDALAGAGKTLQQLELIYLEKNFVERYRSSPNADKIDRVLAEHGFEATWSWVHANIGTGFTAYTRAKGHQQQG